MSSPVRRRFFLILRLLCSLALLVWVWQRTRLGQAGDLSWHIVNPSWLVVAIALGALSVLGWAVRWLLFLRVYEIRPKWADIFRLTLFADFFNLYFLGPLGADGIRLLLLSRKFPTRKGAIVGSIAMDHVGGLFGGAIFYFLYTRRSTLFQPPWNETADLVIAGIVALTFLGLGIVMEPWLQDVIRKIPGLGRLMRPVEPVYAGRHRHPWLFAGIGVSWISLGCVYASYWAAAQALGEALSLNQVLAVMPVVDMVASLPITISGLGVRENLFVEFIHSLTGMAPASALAVSLLGFVALGLWGLVGGIWLAIHRHHQAPTAPASPPST